MSDAPGPAERQDVVAALRLHGLSALAAASLWTIARELIRDTRRRGREYSAMFDAERGVETGPRLSGEAHQIDIARQLDARHSGREYGHVHTHPANGAFSAADVRVLLTNRDLRTLVAVGIDGRWHIMSRAPDMTPADAWTASDRFVAEFRRLLDEGSVSITDASHAVWSTISEGLGLRYSRIEG
jgi:hypothetical protein